MDAKENKTVVQTFKNTFSNIPVSKKTISGMSWTIDDRKYLQLCFNILDLEYDKKIDKVFSDLGETFRQRDAYFTRKDEELNAKFDTIIDAIKKTNKNIDSINRKLASIKKVQKQHGDRILALETKFENFETTFGILQKEHEINHKKAL
jgi:hypothetical protein